MMLEPRAIDLAEGIEGGHVDDHRSHDVVGVADGIGTIEIDATAGQVEGGGLVVVNLVGW